MQCIWQRYVLCGKILEETNMKEKDPNHEIAEVFYRLNIGVPVELSMLEKTFKLILTHPQVKARDSQLGAFLAGIMVKGPLPTEVETLVRTALNIDGLIRFRPSIPIGEKLVGVAGSGKKGFKTFNVSTPACIVAAAAGAYVAKPGSSATSSLSGSIDFLSVVGAHPLTHQEMTDILLATGFGIFSIERLIPKFDGVYGGKTFGPTPLSFCLPAIANPIVCDALLYGLSHPNIGLSQEVFQRFGYSSVTVVASSFDGVHYIDELTPAQESLIGEIQNGNVYESVKINFAEIVGIANCEPEDLCPGESLIENIQLSVGTLSGKKPGHRENTVALNAAAILVLGNKTKTLAEGFVLAKEVIKSGSALDKLNEFVLATGGNQKSIKTLL